MAERRLAGSAASLAESSTAAETGGYQSPVLTGGK